LECEFVVSIWLLGDHRCRWLDVKSNLTLELVDGVLDPRVVVSQDLSGHEWVGQEEVRAEEVVVG